MSAFRALVALFLAILLSPGAQEERVRVGDIVFISTCDASTAVEVRPDGRITLPVVGDLRAEGLTIREVRDRCVERLADRGWSCSITVHVRRGPRSKATQSRPNDGV